MTDTDSPHVETVAVGPAAPPASPARWPLTPIDCYALRWLIQGTWVFDTDLDPEPLKRGLARLLEAYPHLSGRISGGTVIEYCDDGVPFTVEVNHALDVDDLDSRHIDVTGFADRRKPGRIKRGRAPLMTVKLTRLRNGWVLAVCCSHACVDGSGFYSMVSNWSRAVTGRPFPSPVLERPPQWDSAARSKNAVLHSVREAGWHKPSARQLLFSLFTLPWMLDRTFVAHFSPETLRQCKQTLARESGCGRLSTNSAVVAHVSRCLVELLRLDPGSNFSVSSVVDMRGRVAAFGENFARNGACVIATPAIPAGAAAGEVAGYLHRRLEPVMSRPSAELETAARLMEEAAYHRLPYSMIPLGDMLGFHPSLFYTNSFWKFPVYDLDFGEEGHPIQPARAVPHNLGDPVILWPAPPSLGGIELYFGGILARAAKALDRDDPWWQKIRRFEPG